VLRINGEGVNSKILFDRLLLAVTVNMVGRF